MPVQAVIFDIDGTLIDSVDQHASAWVEALSHFGYKATFEDVRSQIGKGGDQLMPVFLSEASIADHGADVEKYRENLFKHKYLGDLRPFPCVVELFEQLKKDGISRIVASSAKAEDIAQYAKIAGIEHLIDTAASSDDAKQSKPAPDIFHAALSKAGIQPHEAVVVGDSPFDAQAAAAAGIKAVGVLCGGFAEKDLRAVGFAAIFRGPEDLLQNYDTFIGSKRRASPQSGAYGGPAPEPTLK